MTRHSMNPKQKGEQSKLKEGNFDTNLNELSLTHFPPTFSLLKSSDMFYFFLYCRISCSLTGEVTCSYLESRLKFHAGMLRTA